MPALDPASTTVITRATNYQGRLDEAWRMLTRRLLSDGNLPWWVADPAAFRETHLTLTLHLICRDLATGAPNAGVYFEESQLYMREYEAAYRGARHRVVKDAETYLRKARRSPSPTLWTTTSPQWLT